MSGHQTKLLLPTRRKLSMNRSSQTSRKAHLGAEARIRSPAAAPLRFAGNVMRPASAYNVGAVVTNPDRYTAVSRSAASAYAYAVQQSSRQR
jgi:hypothetical protein